MASAAFAGFVMGNAVVHKQLGGVSVSQKADSTCAQPRRPLDGPLAWLTTNYRCIQLKRFLFVELHVRKIEFRELQISKVERA